MTDADEDVDGEADVESDDDADDDTELVTVADVDGETVTDTVRLAL